MEHTVTRHELVGGAELLVVNMKQAVSFYLGCYLRAGFEYAPEGKHELPHLLEHLMFDGCVPIPNGHEFKMEVEKYGAAVNAATAQRLVWYYYLGGASDLVRLTRLSANQVYFPAFTETNVKQQIGVIKRELEGIKESDGRRHGLKYLEYVTGNVEMADVDSRIEGLQTITRQELMDFHGQYYVPANSRWIVVGAVSEEDLKQVMTTLNESLSELGDGSLQKLRYRTLQPFSNKPYVLAASRPDQAIFSIDYVISGKQLLDRAARRCLTTILTGGLSGRLFTKAREAGLTYSINSVSSTTEAYSSMGVMAQTTNTDVPALFELICDELTQVAGGIFTQSELDRAKRYIVGGMDRSYQLPVDFAGWYATDFVTDEPLDSPGEWIAEIEAVTLDDIKEAAAKYVVRGNGLTLLVGNKLDASTLEDQLAKIPK